MQSSVEREVERRMARGYAPVSVKQLNATLARLGYKLDRSCDCRGENRYITGELVGEHYPATNAYPVEIDTGMSAFHVDARRDENYRELQRLRYHEALYAVVRGRILEI
jgi:hypothetical protein